MPRPKKCRKISFSPQTIFFKPCGIPRHNLNEVILEHDEIEALRLADLQGDSHEEAANKMKISRATFGRIITSARSKTADAIINGKAININI